ncbi:MAG TPA: hypothetical protein VG900_09350 [Hyphomicrobiaceae bacterium]|nr:hypothetical protein [Hyphomicrobiaceae bacterium]
MVLKYVPLTTLALAAGLLATPASAAPAPAPGQSGVTPASTSLVQKAAWRRCWWRHGRRHCRWYGGWGWRHHHHWYRPYHHRHWRYRHHRHYRHW